MSNALGSIGALTGAAGAATGTALSSSTSDQLLWSPSGARGTGGAEAGTGGGTLADGAATGACMAASASSSEIGSL